MLKLLVGVPCCPSMDIDAAASKSDVESRPLFPKKLNPPFVVGKGSWEDRPNDVVDPSNVGGSSSKSKAKDPGTFSAPLKNSRVSNGFESHVVKNCSSILDSVSSRRAGPGGGAGAGSNGVSSGRRK